MIGEEMVEEENKEVVVEKAPVPAGTREEKARERALSKWVPKTRTGKLVMAGEITSLEQIYERNLPLLEPEIIDYLVPDLQEDALDVGVVQRATDSGRRQNFLVTAVVGNKDGYVGIGMGKARNVKPAIERAVRNAKMKVINIRRGCGSWECGCGNPHSIPFRVEGKCGSVRITLFPAPKGTGIIAGDKAKKVLEFAGVKDVWSRTAGDARTTFNFARATLNALKNTRRIKLSDEKLKVHAVG